MGLKVLPPDVASRVHVRASDARTIRYGLGAVKGVGARVPRVEREREPGGAFRDLLDFCQRVDSARLNKRVLEALVNAGALDALGANRASLMLQLPEATRAANRWRASAKRASSTCSATAR